jgi:beta-galactosidase
MKCTKPCLLILLLMFFYTLPAQQQLFTIGWQFHKGDIGHGEKNLSDTIAWRSVNLPHDWSIEGPFSEEWASATGYLPGGIGWYKKTFTAPISWQAKQLYIYFDGVYNNSTVWLNGHYLGNRPNGFIPFEYGLTKYLNYKGQNVLMVKVDHSEFADSRWYTGSGIYRNVYLVVKEPVHIATWGVQFTTPTITRDIALTKTKIRIVNTSGKNTQVIVHASLEDNKGVTVAQAEGPLRIRAGDSTESFLSFAIRHPRLWSVDDPYLYRLSVSVMANGKSIDTWLEQTGIRKPGWDADKGFFLNGKNMKLKGVCIHDDAGALGVAVPEAVWRRRLQLLKEAGCNSLRMSHNPHADYLYKLCDEMGFLVIDEAFDEWEAGKNKWIKGWNVGTPGKDGYHSYFNDWAQIDLRDMILRNFNHPSIIAWSIGNEIDYPNDPYSGEVLNTGNNPQIYGRGYLPDHPSASRLGELSQQLAKTVKTFDTTRPVTAALAGVVMSNTTSYPDNLDWVGYNYQEYRYQADHAAYPKRIIYGSENNMQLRSWNAVDSNDYISSQYLWTGIDYLGEAGRWPQRSNSTGLLDLAGFAKSEYYFRQSLWSEKPMVYLGVTRAPNAEDRTNRNYRRAESNWNWKDGDQLRVHGFTNCEEAELFVNGRSLGKKPLADFPNRIIYWDVPYTAGTLKLVGYKNRMQATVYAIKTSGAPYALKAIVEKDKAGKTGLHHIIIQVVDKDGIIVPDAENEIAVAVHGNASLLGLESGSPTSHEDYKAGKRKSVRGKLLAYVMKNDKVAPVTVVLTSAGLVSANVILD